MTGDAQTLYLSLFILATYRPESGCRLTTSVNLLALLSRAYVNSHSEAECNFQPCGGAYDDRGCVEPSALSTTMKPWITLFSRGTCT